MVCQRCGTLNEDEDQFCGNCGAVLVPSRPVEYRAPASPATQYGGSMNAPTMAQPLPPSQTPTQYVPPRYSPGAGWAARQGNYAPASQETWPDAPVAQPLSYAPSTATWPRSARRKHRRWPLYLLLFLVIFGLVAAGSWVLLVRPAVHQAVDGQIGQGLQQSVDQIPAVPPDAPAGIPFTVAEGQLNDYLAQKVSQLAPITDLNASLQPGVMVVTFQTYGFGSMVSLGLAIHRGALVAKNVSVSGVLSWVESADDLTARFDEALSQVPGKLGRQVASVTIGDGELQLSFA